MLIGTAAQEIHHCKLCHMAWASFEQEIAQAPGLFGGFPIVRDRYAVAAHPAPLSLRISGRIFATSLTIHAIILEAVFFGASGAIAMRRSSKIPESQIVLATGLPNIATA